MRPGYRLLHEGLLDESAMKTVSNPVTDVKGVNLSVPVRRSGEPHEEYRERVVQSWKEKLSPGEWDALSTKLLDGLDGAADRVAQEKRPSVAALVYGTLPAFRAPVKKAVKFLLTVDMAAQAHELSLSDWRLWWDRVVPCYDTMFIEMEVAHLDVTIPGAPYRFGWLWDAGKVRPFAAYPKPVKTPVLPIPYIYEVAGENNAVMMSEDDPKARPILGRELGWGQPLAEKIGTPDYGFAFSGPLHTLIEKGDLRLDYRQHIMEALIEYSGNARLAFACLALINSPTIRTNAEDRPEAKHLIKGTPTPAMVFKTLRIHAPPPIVLEEGGPAETAYSTPKREHDVRGHERTLKGGRKVWIRAHKRGDASLGQVVKDYVL